MTAPPLFDHAILFWAQPADPADAARLGQTATMLAARGQRVLVAWGGPDVPDPVPGVTLAPLPPALITQASGEKRLILDEKAQLAAPDWKKRRTAALLALFQQSRPRLLLLDRFPYGWGGFRYELRPLLEMAHRRRPRPLAFSLSDGMMAVDARSAALLDGRAADPAALPHTGDQGSGET